MKNSFISFYKYLIAFLIKARIKKEKASKPLLKKITWEKVKLVSVDVRHDD